MLDLEKLISDPYNRKARLLPALFTLLPVLVTAVLLIQEFQSKWSWSVAVGMVAYCGGAMLLTQLGRDCGKALEPKLFKAWGGKPSVAMLRHNDCHIQKATKARYHAFLKRRIPGLKLASPAQEKRSLVDADDGYSSATDWLLEQTRDLERFRLIFEENTNYGFRRNMLGLKCLALIIDGLIILVLLPLVVIFSLDGNSSILQLVGIETWGVAATAVIHMSVFGFLVRRDWVRVPADAFARQLLAACDKLDSAGR